MAIAATTSMNQDEGNKSDDEHDHDMVMPGFRFHPTEEELVEFYLRRKVEGKRFNVELITFLDLYRYDPWELPALAAIGEKEWFFYVPRDRKYRNGDRPNRVTTSGYWKATGADRMIRTENFRSIGLKKTLVFYTGKAPKGIRTSWIMNEYRLPQHETERLQKAEISLCRVYKRAGVEDHPSLPRLLPTRVSTSRGTAPQPGKKQPDAIGGFQAFGGQQMQVPLQLPHQQQQQQDDRMSETSVSSTTSSTDVGTVLGLSSHSSFISLAPTPPMNTTLAVPPPSSLVVPNCNTIFSTGSSSLVTPNPVVDDLHRLINYQQASMNHQNPEQDHHHHNSAHTIPSLSHFSSTTNLQQQPSTLQATFPDRLWEQWNPISEAGSKDYPTGPFK